MVIGELGQIYVAQKKKKLSILLLRMSVPVFSIFRNLLKIIFLDATLIIIIILFH